jgi:predicted lysophospholipase L1 biosynthesis ABC-type transport system permease subunit
VSDLRPQFSTPLIVLMSMVGVVLLIACANVANLLLARTTARQKEISLRLALGASRARIVRHQLIESGLLALAGTLAGLLLAWWTGSLLIAALPGDPAARNLSADPDLRVTLFALAVGVLTALVFGTVPALHATRSVVTSALKEESGNVAGGGRQARLRRVLVVAQVALSMLLLAEPAFGKPIRLKSWILASGGQPAVVLTILSQRLRGQPPDGHVSTPARGAARCPAASVHRRCVLTGNQWGMSIRVDGYQPKEGGGYEPQPGRRRSALLKR